MPEIRPATLPDARSLAELAAELGYPATEAAMAGRLKALQSSTEDAILVAVNEERVTGWIHVGVRLSLEQDPRAEVLGLIVTTRYQGTGIGRSLMEAAEVWARAKGRSLMRVRTSVGREEAHRFYERIGYEKVKEQRVYQKRL